jgi:predicted esterase
MHQLKTLYLIMLIGLTVSAQTINLGGIVSNNTAKPIANAIVTLVRQGMKDTTGTDGKYSFARTVAIQLPTIVPQTGEISMNNGALQFTLSNSSPMKVEIFDAKGNLLKKEVMKNAPAGTYRFDIAKNCRATNLLIIKAAIGNREVSFPYMTLNSGKYALNKTFTYSAPVDRRLARLAAIVDTLKITAAGFQTKTMTITSYDNQQQNISLDSSGSKNAPGPSIGCGKTFSTLKSGSYTIKSSGTNRTYYIKIPSNYDKNNPYRLIFAMHCMGCDAATMNKASDSRTDGAYNYYGLGSIATNAILVAPQGNSDGTWNGDKDHAFVDDMLKLFKDTLCIDTTRVFSCGFSFGAMFTYSLSTNHQKQLRAVACYAPANYNIWLPTNTHEPIGYFQTTGTSDGTCPWDNGGRGGRYCLQGHIQDNGGTVPSSIPLANSNKHVSTEFPCKDGYPTKFSSFQGGHTANSTENGANWIPTETWEFFTRF